MMEESYVLVGLTAKPSFDGNVKGTEHISDLFLGGMPSSENEDRPTP